MTRQEISELRFDSLSYKNRVPATTRHRGQTGPLNDSHGAKDSAPRRFAIGVESSVIPGPPLPAKTLTACHLQGLTQPGSERHVAAVDGFASLSDRVPVQRAVLWPTLRFRACHDRIPVA